MEINSLLFRLLNILRSVISVLVDDIDEYYQRILVLLFSKISEIQFFFSSSYFLLNRKKLNSILLQIKWSNL
jgi:hypothetical protein